MLIFCVYCLRKYQYLLEDTISHKNLKFVSLRIYLSKKYSCVSRFYSYANFGLLYLELFRTHQGIRFITVVTFFKVMK